MKQMVLAFFDADRIVYTKMVKKRQSVNTSFIVDALDSFLKIFSSIGPQLVEQGCLFPPGQCTSSHRHRSVEVTG